MYPGMYVRGSVVSNGCWKRVSLLSVGVISLLSGCDAHESPDVFFSPYKFNKSCLVGDYVSNTWRGTEEMSVQSDGIFSWSFVDFNGEKLEHEGTWTVYGDEKAATNVSFEDVMFAGFYESDQPWTSDNWNPYGVPTLFRRIKLDIGIEGYQFVSVHKCEKSGS